MKVFLFEAPCIYRGWFSSSKNIIYCVKVSRKCYMKVYLWNNKKNLELVNYIFGASWIVTFWFSSLEIIKYTGSPKIMFRSSNWSLLLTRIDAPQLSYHVLLSEGQFGLFTCFLFIITHSSKTFIHMPPLPLARGTITTTRHCHRHRPPGTTIDHRTPPSKQKKI